jgi:hypothetical protein
MLETIEGLLLLGFIAGCLVGVTIPSQKIGCLILLAIPIGMIGYIAWWQNQHPENIRSTSGLDFIFGPLWPSISAITAFYLSAGIRDRIKRK